MKNKCDKGNCKNTKCVDCPRYNPYFFGIKVPKKLAGCTRIKDEAEKATGMNTEGAKYAPVAPVSDKEITYHQKPVYGLKVGDGEIITFDNMKDRNDEYDRLVKEHREAGRSINEIEKLSPEEVQDAYKKQHPEN